MFYDEEELLEAVDILMEDYGYSEDEAIDLLMEDYYEDFDDEELDELSEAVDILMEDYDLTEDEAIDLLMEEEVNNADDDDLGLKLAGLGITAANAYALGKIGKKAVNNYKYKHSSPAGKIRYKVSQARKKRKKRARNRKIAKKLGLRY